MQEMAFDKEIDKQSYNIRTKPLGLDRHFNRFWLFNANLGGEANGMIVVERTTTNPRKWALIHDQEKFDELVKSLNDKGIREKVQWL